MEVQDAYQHPYLDSLRACNLPNMPGALVDFYEQYRGYSRSFPLYLKALMSTIKDPDDLALLQDNMDEEMGLVHDDEILNAGLKLEWVQGIRHTDLFTRFGHAIGANPNAMIDPIVTAWERSMLEICGKSMGFGLGALGQGTEALVPILYAPIWEAIKRTFPDLHPRDTCFFPLHIHCDDDHAVQMQQLVAKYPQLQAEVSLGRDQALELRRQFYDCMLKRALAMPSHHAAKLYDGQASHWARMKPTCLSDFTARPKVLEACEPVANKKILDLGCGDGYCTRLLLDKGARSVVGIDISKNMIEAAVAANTPSRSASYFVGDATSLLEILESKNVGLSCEGFDVVVAVFLFNYVSMADMQNIMAQVRQVLKPGGKFVFSVPHPCFPFWARDQKYPFYFDLPSSNKSYFELRDTLCHGKIWRQDGQELLVHLKHKTMQDYFVALRMAGFSTLPDVQELHADANLQMLMPAFVGNLKGMPLHMCFTVETAASPSWPYLQSEKHWNLLPSESACKIELPSDFLYRLKESFAQFKKLGHSLETIHWFCNVDGCSCGQSIIPSSKRIACIGHDLMDTNQNVIVPASLQHGISSIAKEILFRLRDPTRGLAIISSPLSSSLLSSSDCGPYLYLLLSWHMGPLLTKRGRLYQVIDRNLDIHNEDVLFSATNAETTWHTDSTDRDYFPDFVGLYCVHQVKNVEDGGSICFTNAFSAVAMLSARALEPLTKPVIRDLIDKGFGTAEKKSTLRIMDNQYPILTSTTFRYMRFWIEKGYMKCAKPVPRSLREAMDALDKALEATPRMTLRLNPGEMVFANNHFLCHNRPAYKDSEGCPRREMLRVWIEESSKWNKYPSWT